MLLQKMIDVIPPPALQMINNDSDGIIGEGTHVGLSSVLHGSHGAESP